MTVSGGRGAGLTFDIISRRGARLCPGYPRSRNTPKESMPVYSMTGYASGQHSLAQAAPGNDARASSHGRLGLEIRCVNSRFLDLSFRLSEELRQHEPALRELLQARLKRGKVELRAGVESTQSEAVREPNARMLQRLASVQDTVRTWLPDARALSVADVLRLGATDESGPADLGAPLLALATRVLDDLLSAR